MTQAMASHKTVAEVKIIPSTGTMTLRQLLEFAKTNPVASNIQVDRPIVRKELREVVRTGTIVVNESPWRKLGKTVEVDGIVFKVQDEFQGMKNVLLEFNLEPGSFTFENDVLEAKTVKVNGDFPAQAGWYGTDEYGIPTGKAIHPSNRNARHSFGIIHRSCIGSVIRNGEYLSARREVILFSGAWHDFRVAKLGTGIKAAAPEVSSVSNQLRTAAAERVVDKLPALRKLDPQLASDIETLMR